MNSFEAWFESADLAPICAFDTLREQGYQIECYYDTEHDACTSLRWYTAQGELLKFDREYDPQPIPHGAVEGFRKLRQGDPRIEKRQSDREVAA